MSDGIYSALSGAIAQQRSLDAAANNLANVNTTGYQADKTIFAEMLNRHNTPNEKDLKIAPSLRYATVSQFAVDPHPGSMELTGRPLDVSLHGDGYFTVRTENGERYTRAGSFVLDQQGVLRTPGGYEVLAETYGEPAKGETLPAGQRIVLPLDAKDIQIARDGTINADGQPLYRFKLVTYDKQEDALREGLTLFTGQEGKQPHRIDPTTSIEQGYLEASNVNAISGMNELISLHRSFDALEKVIDTFREIDNRTVRDVGGKV
ncbi:MAG: flagellar basal-body rod protein FlgF [Pseudomonadota bacterium]|jgi:flagellar basal body rod protein FlgG